MKRKSFFIALTTALKLYLSGTRLFGILVYLDSTCRKKICMSVKTEVQPERSSSWVFVNPPLNIMHDFQLNLCSSYHHKPHLNLSENIDRNVKLFVFKNRTTLCTSVSVGFLILSHILKS